VRLCHNQTTHTTLASLYSGNLYETTIRVSNQAPFYFRSLKERLNNAELQAHGARWEIHQKTNASVMRSAMVNTARINLTANQGKY
jgi:hypothetical protein